MKTYMYLAIALTVFCWGIYGPVLHIGQSAMQGSRLRPLICVGLAYFLIGVIVPLALLMMNGEKGEWTQTGVIWSLAGGAAGAIGALGIIMAFNFGGSPAIVTPLVFGLAPVVNAFWTIGKTGAWKEVSPLFLVGLAVVAVGAFLTLKNVPTAHGPKQAHRTTTVENAKV